MDENEVKIDYDLSQPELNQYSDIDMSSWFYDISYTPEQALKFTRYPMSYHKELMRISEEKYNSYGHYGQTVSKMVSAPTLDYVLIPARGKAKKQDELLHKGYLILDNKINHRLISGDALLNSILYGEYVGIWRDTKKKNVNRPSEYATGDKIEGSGYIDNMIIQPLDLQYCRFEGFANGDHVVSFDLSYFDQFRGTGSLVGELKNYPEMFLKGYNVYKRDSSKRWMLLPQEITFSYKFHAALNESHGRPLVLFALKDILFSEDYTDAQRNNMYENGSNISWYKLPQGKEPGSCALNDKQQKEAYKAFKGAVNLARNKKNIGHTIPLKLPQGTEIGNLSVGDTFLKNTLTDENAASVSLGLGMSTSLFSCSGENINFASLQMNIDLMLSEVYTMLDQFSIQYTKLLNNYLGLKEPDEQITFSYLHTSKLTKDKDFQQQKELFTLAAGSRRYLYSIVSGNADLYMRMLDFEDEMDYDGKYQAHPTSYTLSNSMDKATVDDTNGRPKSNIEDLSPTGEQTRDNNLNNVVKPSTK